MSAAYAGPNRAGWYKPIGGAAQRDDRQHNFFGKPLGFGSYHGGRDNDEDSYAPSCEAPHPTSAFMFQPPVLLHTGAPPGALPISIPHQRPSRGSASVSAAAISGSPVASNSASAVVIKFLALEKVNQINFKENFGITMAEHEIDLDHTSCEEEDCETASFRAAEFEDPEQQQPPSSLPLPQRSQPPVKRQKVPDETTLHSTNESVTADSTATSRRSASSNRWSSATPSGAPGSAAAGAPVDEDDSESLVQGGSAAPTRSLGGVGVGKSGAVAYPKKKRKIVMGDFNSTERLSGCFLCGWGNHEYDSVNNEHMQQLFSLIYDHIGDIPTTHIAKQVHALYKNRIRPAAVGLGQWLPIWRSKEVFVCIESHNFIPEIKLARDIRNASIVQAALERKLFFTQNGGEDLPNAKTMKQWNDVMRMKWLMYGMQTEKMAFHKPSRVTLGADNPRSRSLVLRKASRQRKVSAIGVYPKRTVGT